MTKLPYNDILETGDRAYTHQLLALLVDPTLDEDEREEVADCLGSLEDSRSFEPLQQITIDTTHPESIREAAHNALVSTEFSYPLSLMREWWHGNDDFLKRHALMSFYIDDHEIVEPIAANPDHPYHREAIACLTFGFEHPRFHQYAIKALAHPDPAVREEAAHALLFDEPVAAEDALLQTSYDDHNDVLEEVLYTLGYYPTRRVLARLVAIRETHAYEEIRQKADSAVLNILDPIHDALNDPDRTAHFKRWLKSVWEHVEWPNEANADETPSAPVSPRKKTALTLAQLQKRLSNPDTPKTELLDLLFGSDWNSIPHKDRQSVTHLLAEHPDLVVRGRATYVCAEWQFKDQLIALAGDEQMTIRKSAMYYLKDISPPSPEIAELAWDYLHRDDVCCTGAGEALDTYGHHAPREEAILRLADILNDRERPESLRFRAIYELIRLEARRELSHAMWIVEEAPTCTWSLHDALLDAVEKLNLRVPDIGHLREIDHAQIQGAIAPHIR